MNKETKKNYTLVVNYKNICIPIIKGSLKEIDDFTTYFCNEKSIGKLFLRDLYDEKKCSFIIMSSKNTIYKTLLNKDRFIINPSNKEDIINWFFNIDKNELIKYVTQNTKIYQYLESNNKDSIPLCKLYHLLVSKNQNYKTQLDYILNSDYNFYRNIAKFYDEQLPKLSSLPLDVEKKKEIQKLSDKIYMNILEEINMLDEEEKEEINIENDILDIISKYNNSDEIIKEISFLNLSEEEEKEYLDKYKSLIYFKQDE